MNYAVIRINGAQYKVESGEEILVDKLSTKKPTAEVLMRVTDKGVEIGTPVLEKSKAKLTVIGDEKGEKVNVRKFKSKSRYRKRIGFTPQFTRLKVDLSKS